MTCIAGLAFGGKVFLGGDNGTYAGHEVFAQLEPKVFRNGDFIFGCAGHGRLGDVMEHVFEPPVHDRHMTTEKYLRTMFVSTLRSQLSDAGFLRTVDGIQGFPELGSTLFGYGGNLYWLDADLQIGCASDGIAGCGTGGLAARAALMGLSEDIPPDRRLFRALEIAERVITCVRGPFTIISL